MSSAIYRVRVESVASQQLVLRVWTIHPDVGAPLAASPALPTLCLDLLLECFDGMARGFFHGAVPIAPDAARERTESASRRDALAQWKALLANEELVLSAEDSRAIDLEEWTVAGEPFYAWHGRAFSAARVLDGRVVLVFGADPAAFIDAAARALTAEIVSTRSPVRAMTATLEAKSALEPEDCPESVVSVRTELDGLFDFIVAGTEWETVRNW